MTMSQFACRLHDMVLAAARNAARRLSNPSFVINLRLGSIEG